MSDTIVVSNLTGVVFDNGATLYGSWTTAYNASSKIISVTNAEFVVTFDGVSTTFEGATVNVGANPFPPGVSPSSPYGEYEIRVATTNTNPHPPAGTAQSLFVDWKGETPTALAVGATSPYRLFTSFSLYSQGVSIGISNAGTVTDVVVCFCEGTRIGTPDGDVAVEALVIGQSVLSAADEAKPIRWIGHRTIDLTRHPDPDMVRPIRIAAGALADGVPARDLLVSPDHAMLVDGALIPARLLVNRRSITEDTQATTVTYYHVELDRHDIITAEGAATESYLDTGNRDVFANAPVTAMIPDMSVEQRLRMPENGACQPLVTQAEAVFPIWQRLADRAGTEIIGVGVAENASGQYGDIALVAGSRTLRPIVAEGDTLIFALPRDTADVRLVSSAERPNKSSPWLDDRRMLGVAVRAVSADHAAVPLDGPAFGTGWWGIEDSGAAAYRWSNGNAMIDMPAGTKLLTVRVHAVMAQAGESARAQAA